MRFRQLPVARAALLALSVAGAEAQDLQAGQAPVRIEIVGSRVPRLDAETALPVQVIRREEIERSGVQTVEELLQQVSANTGGQTLAMGAGNTDTPGFSGASLRGFGAAETLVLLNGRRLANYAFTGLSGPGVDLNAIPLAAIDRVEILKDGASALYGTDAIAGVINFVTRQDYVGRDASFAYAVPQAGGGERARTSLGAGTGQLDSDGWNAFVVLDLKQDWHLRAIDRDFTSTTYRPELGLNLTSPASFPANIVRRVNGQRVLLNPAAPACTDLTVNRGQACLFDPVKLVDLLPRSEQANLLGRGTWRLGADGVVYAEVSASRTRTGYGIAPSPIFQNYTRNNTPFDLPESSPYYPAGLGLSGPLKLAFRTLALGQRKSDVTSTNARWLAGLKGSAAGWDLDGAVALNDSVSTERYLSGMVDAQKMSDAIATGLVNPFGPQDATGLALLRGTELTGMSRQARGRTQTADLRGNRDLLALPAGPLALAAGIELRHEDLRDVTTSLLDDDVAGGGSGPPKQGQRSVQAAYAELVAPLVRGVELQAAARLDRYNDFGRTFNPKLALRVQPSAGWLLRGSVGRGFRAPSLPELYTQQGSSILEFFSDPDPVRCPVTHLDADCQPVLTVVSGGNPAVKPQTSTQAGLGLVALPAPGWQLSVDLWAIRVRDIIGTVTLDDVVANYARYEGRNVFRGPVDPAFPNLPGPLAKIVTINENLGDWRVDGTDLSLVLAPQATPWGRFGVQLDGTWTHRAHQAIFNGDDVDLIGRIVPRWKHMLTLTADQGPYSATLSNGFRLGYVDQYTLPDGSQHHVASQSVWDAQVAWRRSESLHLSLGLRNIFDRRPSMTNQSQQSPGGFDPIYADARGRTWTFRLRTAWR